VHVHSKRDDILGRVVSGLIASRQLSISNMCIGEPTTILASCSRRELVRVKAVTLIRATLNKSLKHGYGSEISPDREQVYVGLYRFGKYDGKGWLINKKRSEVYKGNFLNGKKHGYGVLK